MAAKTFTGGDKLESVLKELAKKLDKSGTLNVGFLAGATYPDGTPVPMIAAIQEFGAPSVNIPPRPYFRNMIAKENGHWGDDLGKLLVHTEYDVNQSLGLMGMSIKGELQQSIKDTNSPPLAPATIKAKGFEKPLVDTGHMQNSVDFEIK